MVLVVVVITVVELRMEISGQTIVIDISQTETGIGEPRSVESLADRDREQNGDANVRDVSLILVVVQLVQLDHRVVGDSIARVLFVSSPLEEEEAA